MDICKKMELDKQVLNDIRSIILPNDVAFPEVFVAMEPGGPRNKTAIISMIKFNGNFVIVNIETFQPTIAAEDSERLMQHVEMIKNDNKFKDSTIHFILSSNLPRNDIERLLESQSLSKVRISHSFMENATNILCENLCNGTLLVDSSTDQLQTLVDELQSLKVIYRNSKKYHTCSDAIITIMLLLDKMVKK